MTETPTPYEGRIVRTRTSDANEFDAIVGMAGTTRFGGTVCSMSMESVKKSFGPLIRGRTYEACDASASGAAVGAESSFEWDPVHTKAPDGNRPPFLAHAHGASYFGRCSADDGPPEQAALNADPVGI